MYGEVAQKGARQTSPQGNPHLLGFFQATKTLVALFTNWVATVHSTGQTAACLGVLQV